MSYVSRSCYTKLAATISREDRERAESDILFQPRINLDARDILFLCSAAKEYLKQDGPLTILGRVQRKTQAAVDRETRRVLRLRARTMPISRNA